MAMEKLYELHERRRLRPHRRRHAADPPRARLPRRAPPAHPLPRQPRLPPADGADPHRRCGSASVAAQAFLRTRLAGRRRRGRSTTSSPSSARSRAWRRASATAPRQVDAAPRRRRDRVRACDVAAARRGRGGAVLRRAARRRATSRSTRSSSTACTASTRGAAPAVLRTRARSSSAREPGDAAARLAARYENLAEFKEIAGPGTARARRARGAHRRRVGGVRALARATTCTTSPPSPRSPTTCWPRAEPAAETVAHLGDGVPTASVRP